MGTVPDTDTFSQQDVVDAFLAGPTEVTQINVANFEGGGPQAQCFTNGTFDSAIYIVGNFYYVDFGSAVADFGYVNGTYEMLQYGGNAIILDFAAPTDTGILTTPGATYASSGPNDLVGLFAAANPNGFDPAYVGNKTNLLNFRNYNNEPGPGLLPIPFEELFGSDTNGWLLEGGAVIENSALTLPTGSKASILLDQQTAGNVQFLIIYGVGTVPGTFNFNYAGVGNTGGNNNEYNIVGPVGQNLLRIESFSGTYVLNSIEWAYVTPIDPDAQDFFNRSGITDSTQQSAVNELVIDLKAAGAWDDLDYFYPMVGASSTSHAQNLKSSDWPIIWNGSVFHEAKGPRGDGSTGYGNTNFRPELGVASYGLYVTDPGAGDHGYVFGYADSITSCTMIAGRDSDDACYYFYQNPNGGGSYYRLQTDAAGQRTGCFQFSTDTSIQDAYQNGVEVPDVGQLPPLSGGFYAPLWVLARNAGGSYDILYSDRQFGCFYFASASWSDSVNLAVYDAIVKFQTALGRNV